MTNTALSRALRLPLAIVALSLVASCGDDEDDAIVLPTPTGKQVVYIADTDGDDVSVSGDEAWVADTGSTTQAVTKISGTATATQYIDMPFSIGSGTDKHLGYRVVEDPADGCPARLTLLDAAGGPRIAYLDGTCVFEIAGTSTGSPFAIRTSLIGSATAGASLVAGVATDLSTVYRLDDVGPFANDVEMMTFSGDDSTLAYIDDFGVWYWDTSTLLSSGVQVNTEQPHRLLALPDGSAVVYFLPGETQYRLVPTDGSAQTLLTNALGVGDSLEDADGAAALSPDGTQLLYVATIGGEKQLWIVPIASPLAEQRVDSAASLLLQTGYRFAFSPDSLEFAWTGDPGSDARLFGATVAAPTVAIALTPSATEEVAGDFIWTDDDTIAYVSDDADQPSPTGASTLRTVAFSAPLTTVALSPDETMGSEVPAFTTCSDGEIVYQLTSTGVGGVTTALYRATPMVAASELRITPEVVSPTTAEIYGFVCTD